MRSPTCCGPYFEPISWQGGRGRGGMVGQVFSLFLSGFPRGWIFKGSGLNLRSGIRGQTRIAKQPISVLFLSPRPLYATTSPEKEEEKKKEQGESWRWRNNGGRSAGGLRGGDACFPKYFTAVIGSWPRKFRQQFHLCRLSIVHANLVACDHLECTID